MNENLNIKINRKKKKNTMIYFFEVCKDAHVQLIRLNNLSKMQYPVNKIVVETELGCFMGFTINYKPKI